MIQSENAEVSTGAAGGRWGFVHSALVYHSKREYLDFVARFVVDGLLAGEPVLVAVPAENLVLLRDVLNDGAVRSRGGLVLADSTAAARNPGRFLALQDSFAEEHPQRRVRNVSELAWPGRTADEIVACVQHEALVNEAFRNRRVTALCLYDAQLLDAEVLAGIRATHPLLWRCGSLHRSTDYAPDDALASCNRPLPARPGAVTYLVRKPEDLRCARAFAADYASWVGLSRDAIEDLQLVVTELATNSLTYTDGPCRLAFWRSDHHLVCEAQDSGRLADPLVGRLNPGSAGPASRGLFLVNAITDLVRTHTAASGTTIQVHLRFDPSPGPTG